MAPVVGVGVGVLVIQDGRMSLGRRRGSHGAGTWSAPGGRLEYGESVEDCARRELLEEAGLELGPITLGPYTSDVFAEVQAHYLTLFVVARQTRGEPRNLEPNKCDGWKCDGWSWFEWGAWPAPLFAPMQSLRRAGFTMP